MYLKYKKKRVLKAITKMVANHQLLYFWNLQLKIGTLDDELKFFLQFLLTNDKFKPPNHKKLICFTLVCLWNVQIQILNQPKRPS